MRHMSKFEWSDAWVLVAAILAAKEFPTASLEHLLAWTDAINKAIPTEAEINGAFTRLIGSGLAKEANGSILPTRAGLRLYSRANFWRRGGAFQETQRVAARLAKLKSPQNPRVVAVSKESLDSAYQIYSHEARKAANEIIEKLVPHN
jgi:hypothetical protein